jgi:hypothetical protein
MKQIVVLSAVIILVVVLVALLSLSPVALDGLGKQNPYASVCKNSAFALSIAQGDINAVRRQISAVNLNEPYIGKTELVHPSKDMN